MALVFASLPSWAEEADGEQDLPPSTLPALLAFEATSTSESDTEGDLGEGDEVDNDDGLPAELLATAAANADEEALVWLVVASERGAGALEAAQAQAQEAFARAMERYDEAMQRLQEALERRDAALEARDERLAEAFERREAALTERDAILADVAERIGRPLDVGPPDGIPGPPAGDDGPQASGDESTQGPPASVPGGPSGTPGQRPSTPSGPR